MHRAGGLRSTDTASGSSSGASGLEQTFWGEVTLRYLDAHWLAKDRTLTRYQVRLFLICPVFFLLVF